MIVVFGSINLDLVIAAPALPRPGETVLAPAMRPLPGGKGANQAMAAARAGAEVSMFGCIGHDAFAEMALSGLRGAGVDLTGVIETGNATGCAAVCVDPAGENQIIVASGANLDARADQVPESAIGPEATLVLQQEVRPEENAALAARARGRGARIVLNVAPAGAADRHTLEAVDVLIVNEIEAEMTAASLGLSAVDADSAAHRLSDTLGVSVVLTRGAEGAAAWTRRGAWSIDALRIKPVDTTGAGDAFCGYLAAILDEGGEMPVALRWASVAAAMACLEEGAQQAVPSRDAVASLLGDLSPARRIA